MTESPIRPTTLGEVLADFAFIKAKNENEQSGQELLADPDFRLTSEDLSLETGNAYDQFLTHDLEQLRIGNVKSNALIRVKSILNIIRG